MKRVAKIFCDNHTRRRFYDYDHTTIYELHRYALAKVKGRGVIRINYEFREYGGVPVIHLIDEFDANTTDTERYYTGYEDW